MARRRSFLPGSLAVVAIVALGGCGDRLSRSPESFRAHVRSVVPELAREEIVVPYEVRPKDVLLARQATKGSIRSHEKAQALARALYDPQYFGLRYDWARNGSAVETLESGHGNCLGLSSVYVGLARGLGLNARYVEASYNPVRFPDGEVIIRAGHVGVEVKTDRGPVWIGFSVPGRPADAVRPVDDVEALAHLYNNRGYEVARSVKTLESWRDAGRYFRLATRVHPGFAGAWNNLGIALRRLGRRADAESAYLAAIRQGPGLASPHQNLGNLYLETGRTQAARLEFEIAARLDGEQGLKRPAGEAGAGSRSAAPRSGDPGPQGRSDARDRDPPG